MQIADTSQADADPKIGRLEEARNLRIGTVFIRMFLSFDLTES